MTDESSEWLVVLQFWSDKSRRNFICCLFGEPARGLASQAQRTQPRTDQHTITLRFWHEEGRSAFLGQLRDGIGQGFGFQEREVRTAGPDKIFDVDYFASIGYGERRNKRPEAKRWFAEARAAGVNIDELPSLGVTPDPGFAFRAHWGEGERNDAKEFWVDAFNDGSRDVERWIRPGFEEEK